MNYKRETVSLKGGKVEYITLQTNEQNSFTRANLLELEGIFEEIRTNPEIRAAVATSENPKFFSNGVDAETIINTPTERLEEEMGQIVRFFDYMMGFDKPFIAEVTGYAMGGGAVLALAADYRYMLEGKARMSFTEVMFGLPLPGSFIDKLAISILPQHLNETSYGGIYKADEALAIGFMNATAPDREALRRLVTRKLEQILKVPASAFGRTKLTLNKQVLANIPANGETLSRNFADPRIMKNLLEAMSALKEKRRPVFE